MTKKLMNRLGLGLGILVVGLAAIGCLPTTTTTGDGAADGSFATSIWPMLIFIVLLFAMMYFLMIRPQRKRQKEHQDLMGDLKRGDRVVTAGGIYGEIDSVRDDSIILKVESGATIRVARNSVVVKQMPPEPNIG